MSRGVRIALRTVAVIVVLAIGLRLALPGLIERYVNRELARQPGYQARIGGVGLAILDGAFAVDDMDVKKRNGRVPVPLFHAPRVETTIDWRALLDGALVAEVVVREPTINLVAGPTRAQTQTGAEVDWRTVVERLMPIRLNRVEIHDGSVHFRDFHADPKVDVYLHHLDLRAENLTNSEGLSGTRVARVALRATPMSGGVLTASAEFDPFADTPTFDFDGSLVGARLADFNDFLRAYAGVDVEKGTMRIYAELESGGRRFDGYLKPFFEDVEVLDAEELDDQSLFASAWEAIVGGVKEVFEDQSHDRVATRVPIRGTVQDPKAGYWATLGAALRNAFVESLVPRLEQSVPGNEAG